MLFNESLKLRGDLRLKYLGFAIALVGVSVTPAIARDFASMLPDGNYRFCSEPPKQSAPNYITEGGMCFRFRKTGREVVGSYYTPATSDSLCIEGTLYNNLIVGTATETLHAEMGEGLQGGDVPYLLNSSEDTFSNEFITLSEKRIQRGSYNPKFNSYNAKVHYRGAVLSLVRFKQYNAGTILPPLNCN